MSHHTRAVTIDAPPELVWPWLVQVGDRRAGFYSYDWIERFVFPGTVHYVEGTHVHRARDGTRVPSGRGWDRQRLGSVTTDQPRRRHVPPCGVGTFAPVTG
jgi:hypothetical protein